jgi:hypothetical protein
MKKNTILLSLLFLILLPVVVTADPAPAVTSVNPVYAVNTGTVSISNLAGTGFNTTSVPTVVLTKSGQTDISATGVTVVSATQITCTFDLTGKTIGFWDIVVTNPDAQTGSLSSGFEIRNPAPTISVISPPSGYNTSPVSISSLTGTGFSTSTYPTVVLRRSGSTNITATSVTGTATSLTCSFDITGKPAGAWDVIVTNPDGQSVTLTNGFTINSNSAAATLTSITPTSGITNTTVSITALSGTGFVGTPQVYLKRSNYNNIYSTVSTASSTTIVGTINLNNQAPGSYQVCVLNSGSDAVCGLSFTINTASTANGTIYFASTPSGAVVLVDSVQKGTTPFTLYNVTPGSYTIKIQRATYLEWADRVTVTAGNQTTVSAKLTSVDSSTTVTTAPPVTVTTATLPPTTVKSTKTVPTPWKDTATTTASPVEITVILGALATGALVLRRK